ncbi:MAG: DUF4399 domain-containing protein [Kiloniellales bacterium]|nr:DUF4399 domain-containing protein [Kiloniellales bacterium]
MYKILISAGAALCLLAQSSLAGETPRPGNAFLYIGWPRDGEVITQQPFRVWFGLRNFGVAPAGIKKANTGHHHLIIDSPLPDPNEEIANDKNHLHFGAGQSEVMLELPPGRHTLQLVMGDHDHVPHNPPLVSRKVTIYVK